MSDVRDSPPRVGRRLRSIFDALPLDAPLSLAELNSLMQKDTEQRILAVLERVFAAHPEPQPPEPAEPA